MSFQINNTTIYYQPLPSGTSVFNASPNTTDKAARRAFDSKSDIRPQQHDIERLTDFSTGEALKATLLATGLATAAVLGGWKIALGGYVIYRGARLIQGKEKNKPIVEADADNVEDSDDFVSPAQSRSSTPPPEVNEEALAALDDEKPGTPPPEINEEDLAALDDDNRPGTPPPEVDAEALAGLDQEVRADSPRANPDRAAPILPPLARPNLANPSPVAIAKKKEPSPEADAKPPVRTQTEARKAESQGLTYCSAVANGWRKGNYFHEKIFKVIAISAFWPLNWLFNKIWKGQMNTATNRATKVAKGIGYFLTFCLVFPWVISLIQIPFKRKSDA